MIKLENFRCLSISYKKASLEVRSLFYLDDDGSNQYINALSEVLGIREVILVSTCNRVEIYYLHDKEIDLNIISLLKSQKGLKESANHLLNKLSRYVGMDACEHLFRVSLGLESQILGDLQIISQVKKAYQISCDHDLSGMFLHRLMHAIFYANKKMVQSTSFRDGTASTSYACFTLAKQLSKTFIDPKILVIGAGAIGRDICLHFSKNDYNNVTILNRTIEKAIALSNECHFGYDSLDKLDQYIKNSDIIISTVESNQEIITKEGLLNMDIALKFFMDLSVPASIEASVQDIPGVLLHSIDDLQQNIEEVQEKRKNALPQIEALIENSLDEFSEWSEEVSVSPIINQLKSTLDEIRRTEISRYTNKISTKEKELVENITQSMIQKIIKFPVMELKSACKRGEEEKLSELIVNLFNLEKQLV